MMNDNIASFEMLITETIHKLCAMDIKDICELLDLQIDKTASTNELTVNITDNDALPLVDTSSFITYSIKYKGYYLLNINVKNTLRDAYLMSNIEDAYTKEGNEYEEFTGTSFYKLKPEYLCNLGINRAWKSFSYENKLKMVYYLISYKYLIDNKFKFDNHK